MTKRKNVITKILSAAGVIVCIVLIPLLVMNVTIIVKSYINPNKVPDFFGIKPFVVQTGSMEETILVGDLVISKTVDPAILKKGDIISFKVGNSVITHRIIELTQEKGAPAFITKGDANNIEDETPVTYSQVEGIYVYRIAKIGNMAMFMQTPMGMIVFIGIPLCAFIIYDIIRRRLQNAKEVQKEDEAQAEIQRLKEQLAEKETDNKDN